MRDDESSASGGGVERPCRYNRCYLFVYCLVLALGSFHYGNSRFALISV